jgi:hypothetical protein
MTVSIAHATYANVFYTRGEYVTRTEHEAKPVQQQAYRVSPLTTSNDQPYLPDYEKSQNLGDSARLQMLERMRATQSDGAVYKPQQVKSPQLPAGALIHLRA